MVNYASAFSQQNRGNILNEEQSGLRLGLTWIRVREVRVSLRPILELV